MQSNVIYHQKGKDPFYKIWHMSGKNIILYVHSDTGSIVCREKIYPIKPGALCFIGARKYHYTVPDKPEKYERSKIFVLSDNLKKILSVLPNSRGEKNIFTEESIVYAEVREGDENWIEQLYAECEKYSDDQSLSEPVLFGSYLKLLAYIRKNVTYDISVPTGGIHKAIEYINKHIAEDISIDEICDAVHISKYHFCRQFKKNTGLTVMKYILQTRMIMAKNLLANENIGISEVSSLCGFCSLSYFSRVFKEQTGLSPNRYRAASGNR